NETIDGTFPAHHPDPTVAENLVQLQEKVAAERCDLGIGFDGDGDRIGVIDARGRILWGDQLMIILARDVLRHHPGAPIIADVKASQVLFDEIAKAGGRPIMAQTGHSLIKARLAETGAPLAGEMSGHIFFADRWYGFDDAIYDGVRVRTADGWWLLRASNTQAIVVVRAESSSEEGLSRLKSQLAAELAASGLSLPED